MSHDSQGVFRLAVGLTAVVAPAMHVISDVWEWYQHGFSAGQLWLNYIAFVPMSWLLLGLLALHTPRLDAVGLFGAILYGAAFTYFAFTTLYALSERIPDYAALWTRLGPVYTVHGGIMIVGGLMFAYSALCARWLPRVPLLLFAAGLVINLVLALTPAPDILQTVGSAVRNAGLMMVGYAVLNDGRHEQLRV